MDSILRKNAGSGLWCSFLMPLTLLPCAITFAGMMELLCFTSLWLTIFFLVNVKFFCFNYKSYSTQMLFYNVLVFPSTIITSWFLSIGFISTYVIKYAAVVLFDWLNSKLLKCCPGSFSVGEAHVMSQGVTLFILQSSLTLLHQFRFLTIFDGTHIINPSAKFLLVLILGCLILMFVLHKFPLLTVGLIVYIPCIIAAAIMMVTWNYCLEQNPMLWLLTFCLQDGKRIVLLLSWIISTLASILFVSWQNNISKGHATTVSRKFFHFVVIAIFLPGIILDPEFLTLASGVAMAAFMALETCRVLKVPPVGSVIDGAFQVFLDEKDSGILILTHIYLLIGCSSPLWLCSSCFGNKVHHICMLSGIISVGFGDTAAALGGSIFGKHRWKGSLKTLEGTACAIIAQLFCVVPFLYLYHKCSATNVLLAFLAIVLTSLLEAKTTQVDNLVLPLFMYCFLSWIQ